MVAGRKIQREIIIRHWQKDWKTICGDLNKNGPPRLRYLKAQSVSRKWHFLGLGDVTLLEEVYHLGVGFGVSEAKPRPVALFLFLLHADADVELSATSSAPYLPVCSHTSCHADKGPNL